MEERTDPVVRVRVRKATKRRSKRSERSREIVNRPFAILLKNIKVEGVKRES